MANPDGGFGASGPSPGAQQAYNYTPEPGDPNWLAAIRQLYGLDDYSDPFGPIYRNVATQFDFGSREDSSTLGPLFGVNTGLAMAFMAATSGTITKDELGDWSRDPSALLAFNSNGIQGVKNWLDDRGLAGGGSGERTYGSIAEQLAHMKRTNPIGYQSYIEDQDREAHPLAYALYGKYYGRKPTFAESASLYTHGTDAQELEDYFRTLPSHLPGIAIGPYTDIRGAADKESTDIYGHASNDQIIRELYDAGKRTALDIHSWYIDMPFQPGAGPDAADPHLYDAIYTAAAAEAKAIWNMEPDPRHIAELAALWPTAPSPSENQQIVAQSTPTPAPGPAPVPVAP